MSVAGIYLEICKRGQGVPILQQNVTLSPANASFLLIIFFTFHYFFFSLARGADTSSPAVYPPVGGRVCTHYLRVRCWVGRSALVLC